jgi:nucleoside-diphosphate-sugar epimerase
VTPARVLISGAGGFLGAAAAQACLTQWPGAEVRGVDLRGGAPGVDVACDLTDEGQVAALVRRFVPDVVLHMAGTTRNADWATLWAANVLALANTVDAVLERNAACRFVVPGSAAEYGDWAPEEGRLDEAHEVRPTSSYGVSKAWQTLLARHYAAGGAQVVVGRVFNLSGRGVPRQYVLGAVAEQLRDIMAGDAEPVVRVGELSAVRDFVDVGDACAALLVLAGEGRPGEVYNICSGLACTVADAVHELVRLSGTGARVASRAPAPDRAGISWSVGSNARIVAETSWRPRVSLRESLARMLT